MKVILNLTVKRKWFDMIKSGEKREEYRSTDNAQVLNAVDRFSYRSVRHMPLGNDAVMVLRNGYRMDSPAIAVRVVWLESRFWTVHPEWGEPKDRMHFAIAFDRIVAHGTYAEVKESIKKGDEE